MYTSAIPWRTTGSSATPHRRASSMIGFTPALRPPPPPEPMATRSFISMAIAQRQPSSTSPMRLASGTRTSVKNTSLNPERPDLHAGRVEVDDEHRDAAVLRLLGVRAGDDGAEVRELRAGGPHLLAVEDPLVAVALGAHLEAGDVGAGPGLGEQLRPDLLAAQRLGDVPLALGVGAELDHRRDHHAEADDVGGGRQVVAGGL